MSLRKKRSSKGGVSTGISSGYLGRAVRKLRGVSIKPKDGKIWVNGEEKEYFDTGNIMKVLEPIEWTKADIGRMAEYWKTGRMLIPTRQVSREELREMYGDAHFVTRGSSRGAVSTGVKPASGTLPSAEDLDAVAEEDRIKWLTARK